MGDETFTVLHELDVGAERLVRLNEVGRAIRRRPVLDEDDRVRVALARAALREGKSVADWNVAAEIASGEALIDYGRLLEHAQSQAVEDRVRASTAEFHALQVTQRPACVVDTEIGDRAIFSGVIKLEPLTATIDSMLDDVAAYAAHKAHFGDPPKS